MNRHWLLAHMHSMLSSLILFDWIKRQEQAWVGRQQTFKSNDKYPQTFNNHKLKINIQVGELI